MQTQGPQHINGLYSVDREHVPGAAGGMLVHFEQHSWRKPKNRWTDEEKASYERTSFWPMENVDCIVITLDGGLNVTPPFRVRRKSEGTEYFDPDTGFITDDIERFPRQWEAYQRGMSAEEQVIGFSLKHYFKSDPAKVEHYKYHKIFTVEQLADMPVTLKQQIGMGAVDDSNKAKAFLDKARSAGPDVAHSEALFEALERIKALEKALSDTGKSEPKKKGRPKKEIEEAPE